MSYTEDAITILKSRGFRMTQPRRRVLELLDKSSSPLSAYEMKDKLDALGEKADIVSIYRIIDCFEGNGLVHRVVSTGKVVKCQLEHEDHCRRQQTDHCHHLFICKYCSRIDEIHCTGMTDLLKTLETEFKFHIEHHQLELSGTCQTCTEKNL